MYFDVPSTDPMKGPTHLGRSETGSEDMILRASLFFLHDEHEFFSSLPGW